MKHAFPRTAALGALAGLLLSLAAACPALAETFTFIPQVSVRETYDSNVNLNGKSDMETAVSGGVRVEANKERFSGYVQAQATGLKYLRLNEYDRIDQNYSAGLEFNATEKVTFNLSGGLAADSAFSSSLANTGEFATRRAQRLQYSVSPSVTLGLGEVDSLTLFYGFSKTDYDVKDYTDSLSHSLGATWSHRLNERTQLLLRLVGTDTETDTARYESGSLMAGFEYMLAETLSARVLAGGSMMHVKPETGDGRNSTNYSADASLTWRQERLTTTGGFLRDMTLSMGGEDVVRDKLYLNFSYALTERLQGILGGNVVASRSNTSATKTQDSLWYEFSPALRYRLMEKAYLGVSYAFGAQRDEINDSYRSRNQVSMDFQISF